MLVEQTESTAQEHRATARAREDNEEASVIVVSPSQYRVRYMLVCLLTSFASPDPPHTSV